MADVGLLYSAIEHTEPKISNGTHRSYKGTHGQMYVYIVKMKNGDMGECSSTSENGYRYSTGAKVSYKKKSNEKSYNKTDIYDVKLIQEHGGGGGKSTYNDPENNLRFIMTMAQELAVETFTLLLLDIVPTHEKIKFTYDVYYKWITGNGAILERDVLEKRWRSLRTAVKAVALNHVQGDIKLKSSKEILALAEDYLIPVLAIKLEKKETDND